ncbi:MAG: YdcF family protein [Rhodospirillales bacterium]
MAIVLGARVLRDGTASRRLSQRVMHVVDLWKATPGLRIVMSGGGRSEGFCEANVMVQLARDCGVPDDVLISEPRSRNTFENIVNSREKLADINVSRVMLVTDDWHMKRALMCCRSLQLTVEATPLPTDITSLSGLLHRLREVPARIKYRFMLPRWVRDINLSGQ